eukprot:TRINITY_DN94893_c0_g1_i1.p1 TRINITY_DN94893_c0_g1~~TRINITY_DN94893_c0_g1_i1.p1  ORF type:complete len:269 (-),score=21.29 TRINITY_DN94893_c0_g1_i1:166-972(-)
MSKPLDYSKWDNLYDSDEEREKEKQKARWEAEEQRARAKRGCAQVYFKRMSILQGELRKNGLFYDIMDESTPDQFIELRWGLDTVSLFGNEVPCSELTRRPKLVYESDGPDSYHTIVFMSVKPMEVGKVPTEAPPVPNCPQWIHWIRINMKDIDDTSGEDVVEYAPPCPMEEMGTRRYFGVLYRQHSNQPMAWTGKKITKSEWNGRSGWFELRNFGETHKLKFLAANLVRTCNDSSVETTMKRFTDLVVTEEVQTTGSTEGPGKKEEA